MRNESGLTLIEILVSMMVFMVVSASVAGTLTVGLKTAVQTRMQTIGKSVAQQQIEEMRSRVFYVPYSSNPDTGSEAAIDLLDRYFPNLGTSDFTDHQGREWRGWYTPEDASYTVESSPDDRGITITVVTRFVTNTGATLFPPADYDSKSENDTPPNSLVAVSVTTSWLDRTGENSFRLDTMISGTGQTVRGAAVDGSGELGCNSNSRSNFSIVGGLVSTTVSTQELSIELKTNAGEAHAVIPQTGCENEAKARAKGGQIELADLLLGVPIEAPFIGVDTDWIMVKAPPASDPEQKQVTSLATTVPLDLFTVNHLGAQARAEAGVAINGVNESRGATFVTGETVSIDGLLDTGEVPADPVKAWIIANPLIDIRGGSKPQASAYLLQKANETRAVGEVDFEDIQMIPLLPQGSNPPAAPAYGLIQIKNFKATVNSSANALTVGGTNVVDYSADIYLFNADRTGCSGYDCYDYYRIDSANPLQNINIDKKEYSLQKLLLAEFKSKTASEIGDATPIENGNPSVYLEEGLLTISLRVGTQVNRNGNNGDASMLMELGSQRLQLGKFQLDISQG